MHRHLRLLLCLLPVLFPAGNLYAQLAANFTASPTSGCAPMVVTLTSTGTGSPSTYYWTFGNGQTSASANPTTSYTTPGTYTVSLTVGNGTSSNTTTKTAYITVKQIPIATFTATNLAMCPGGTASFSSSVTWNAAGTGSYFWDFGDGGSSTVANPTHTFTNPGIFTVTLTVTNSVGCPGYDTMANLITVYTPPNANFFATDTAVCQVGGSTTFVSTTTGSGPLTYTWDFGDGTTSTSGSPVSHSYLSLGGFTTKLYATDIHGCVDSEVKANYIHVRSVTAGLLAPASGCVGASVPMVSSSSTGSYIFWRFGDGNTDTGIAPSHIYTSPGTYILKMYASIGGCTDSVVRSIVINPHPNASFTFPPVPCPTPSAVTFTNTSTGAVSYSWNFGDLSSTSTLSSPTHIYPADDTFIVVLTATNSYGCQASALASVIIRPVEFYVKADVYEGCIPLTVHFRDSIASFDDLHNTQAYPASISTRSWNFGDGSSIVSGANPTHTYTTAGTFVVTLTVNTSNGCTFIDTLHINTGIHASPNFGGSPRTVCVNDFVHFIDSTTGGPPTLWTWEFGDGGSALSQNPFYLYTFPGVYTVKLTTSVNGCKDTISRVNYITVNFPKALINYRVSCDTPRLVHFNDSLIGATSHIWYFGDGTSTTQFDPTHQYATNGFYVVSLVAFNSTTGCRDSALYQLNLNPVTPNFSANDTTICRGDQIKLTSFMTGLGGVSAYSWWVGTGLATPNYIYNPLYPDSLAKYITFPSPGRYHVGLEIRDQHGCPISTKKNNYITVGGPIAHFKAMPLIGCGPSYITFTDTSIYTPTLFGVLRNWDFGDGTTGTSTGASVTHFYPTTGTYSISLVTADNLGCTDSLGVHNYLIISHPHAGFTTLNTNACVGAPMTFFNTSIGNGLTYFWTFGDGGTSTASSPAHIYNATGTYTVSLIVTDNVGCRDTMTKLGNINVYARPDASFTMDDSTKVCPPLIVHFTNTSVGAVSYNWSFGNGSVSTLTNPSNTYISPALNTVRLIAVNAAGCTDTAFGHVRILGYAGVLSYSPLQGCAPLTVNFKANNVTGVAGFIYDFDDSSTAGSTSTTISHTYTTPGPHVPKITLTDNLGCSVTSIGIDTIKVDGVIPGFTFSPFPACDKGTITFIDTSRGAYSALATRLWTFHDGTTSTQASPVKTYPGPGSYNVTLMTSTTTGCKDTFKSKIVFYPLPSIDAGIDTIICLTDAAILRPTGGVSYTWSPTATLSCSNCTNPQATPTVQTRYTVIGTDAHGCTNTDTVSVRIRIKTTASVGPGKEICSGEAVQLTVEGGSHYVWSPPTGLSATDIADPIANPQTTQHYTVITQLAACIPDTDYVDIIVHPTPTVDAGRDQTIIAGNMAQLEAIGSGFITHWSWNPGDNLSCNNCAAPEATPKRTTLYTVIASTEFNCLATDTVRVFVMCDNSQVFMPNTFTPDGNGVNDVFYPRGKGISLISHFRIYDRWGELVFERTNIKANDEQEGWNGRKQGRLLSPDVYVYVLEAICDNDEPIKWQGDVMLLR